MVDVSSGRKVRKQLLPALNGSEKNFFNTTLEDVYKAKYGGRMPLLTENVATGIGTGLKAIGIPKYRAEDVGRRITSLVNDWTPVGALPAIEKGGPVGTGLGVLAALPIVGGKAGKVAKAVEEVLPEAGGLLAGIKGYHGSPHSFAPEEGAPLGRFRDTAIGTGEGAQAYGRGHYIAESEGVAKSYRDVLSQRGPDMYSNAHFNAQKQVERFGNDPEWAAEVISDQMNAVAPSSPEYQKLADTLDFIKSGKYKEPLQDAGSMYEVEIAADPEHFLDWDKPLSEQSKAVQDSLLKAGIPEEYLKSNVITGGSLAPKRAEYASELQQAGIPGIRYLDQGSRGKLLLDGQPIPSNDYVAQAAADAMGTYGSRDAAIKALGQHPGYKNTNKDAAELLKSGRLTEAPGTRNYVVFDPAIINIVRKYGLAAAIGAGIVTEEMGRQMQAQGEI